MQAVQDRTVDKCLGFILGCAAIWCLLRLHNWLPFVSGDLHDYVLPWYQHILTFGRWHSAEASFANYSPSYIYLLCIASFLNGLLSPVAVIKLVDLPFLFLAAIAGWSICRDLGSTHRRAALGAGLIVFLPELCENCWRWGQCDVIYTSLLVTMAALLLKGRAYAGFVMLGLAFAFKLQAVFVCPVIVALLLAGDLPFLSIIPGVVVYLLMLLPAHLAGRPWKSLMSVYGAQYGYYNELTLGAPNIYVPVELITHRFPATVRAGLRDNNVTHFGLVLGVVFSAGLIVILLRRANLRRGIGLVMSMSLSLIGLPFVLPKMHERYFIAGDTLLAVAAVVRPRLIIPAALMQAALVMSYEPFLSGRWTNRDDLRIPFVLASCAMFLLIREMLREARRVDDLTPAPPPGHAVAWRVERVTT